MESDSELDVEMERMERELDEQRKAMESQLNALKSTIATRNAGPRTLESNVPC